MYFSGCELGIGVQFEMTIFCWQINHFFFSDQGFGAQAIGNQVFIEMIRRSNFSATLTRSGRRAMVPSSFMISTSTPAGSNPASLLRSMVASV